MKAVALIYSPKEGAPGRTERRWRKICRYLELKGLDFDYVRSDGHKEVERLAAMFATSGCSTIVVVGGDAALNSALCGILSAKDTMTKLPALGVIPNGYGNDFARFWGLPADDWRVAAEAVLHRHTRKVDVGVAKEITEPETANELPAGSKDGKSTEPQEQSKTWYFLNCLNLGVVASVTNLRRRMRRLLLLDTFSYFISSFCLIFAKMGYTLSFCLPGEKVNQQGMTMCVGSAKGYGLTPSAVPYNGLLDITLVKHPRFSQTIHGLWLLYTGRFLSHRGISVWRTKSLRINDCNKIPVSIDGRMIQPKAHKLSVNIMPEVLDFVIP